MQMLAAPGCGVGHALGWFVETLELDTVEPSTLSTVAAIRASVRQPVPVALAVMVVPEQGRPFDEPNGASPDTA
jgi:hypothetical protein